MNLKNLVIVIAALFIVSACESTSTETGKAAGSADRGQSDSWGLLNYDRWRYC